MRRLPSRRRNVVDPLQLQARRLRRARAARRRPVRRDGAAHGRTAPTREYLVIEYAPSKRGQPGDRLFVPTDQLDQVTRYVGGEAPSAAQAGRRRLGASQGPGPQGGPGDRGRADPALRRPAGRARATPSAPDTPWQRELEDAFPYVETPDQLAAIDEVKADMEKPVPMDRLICGDVGYGKTEIAVRAAFKAVQDGKQVAVLVPTTLLVQQHLDDVRRAARAVPGARCAALSRFQTDKEAEQALDGPGRRHRRRRHRHPPAAQHGASGSRTSAWSSSTRSSASASSTRST